MSHPAREELETYPAEHSGPRDPPLGELAADARVDRVLLTNRDGMFLVRERETEGGREG